MKSAMQMVIIFVLLAFGIVSIIQELTIDNANLLLLGLVVLVIALAFAEWGLPALKRRRLSRTAKN